MNILKITDSQNWDIGSYQILHLSLQFKKKGHDTLIICPEPNRLFWESRKFDLKAKSFDFPKKAGFFRVQDFRIAHFYDMCAVPPLFLKLNSPEIRIIFTHTEFCGDDFSKLEKLKNIASKFIAPSKTFKEKMSGSGIPENKIFIIPPGINMTRWESAMLIKPAMFMERPYKIGLVSDDKTLREQEFFLNAAKKVLEKIPNTNFLIVGLKDEAIRILARKMEISHKVDILGERTDIPEIMALLHVFVNASDQEKLSMSVLEAQASGVPCVLPRCGISGDFVINEKNGVLVESWDAQSYSKAIIRLIENPILAQTISKFSHDWVENNMSIQVTANLLMSVYEEVLLLRQT